MNRTLVSLGISAFLACGSAAHAAGISFGKTNSYAQVSLGAVFPDDLEFAASTPTITGAGSIELDTGFTASIAVGYHFTDWLAFEAEAGYAGVDASTLSGAATLPGPTVIAGSVSIEGDIQTLPIYVNAVVRPRIGEFMPYVGGGVGGLWYEASVDSVAGIPVNESTSDFVFSAHADAGIEFDVGSNILVGARYRYTWVDSADWIFDDASFHSASITFRMPY